MAVGTMLLWCFISILFFEKLEANNGLGWDGYRYADIATYLFNSSELDSYTIMRILPSLIVHIIFSIFSIAFTPSNIILAFEILNTTLLCISIVLTLEIFNHFKLSDAKKALGLVLVFGSYGCLNFPFYYPVMTDTAGFVISIAIFYFFLKRQTLNLWLMGIIATFTWPIALLQVLALLFFNETNVEFKALKKRENIILFIAGFLWGCGLAYYFLIVQGERDNMKFTLPIDENLLWLSMLSVGFTSAVFSMLIANKTFFEIAHWKHFFSFKNIIASLSILVLLVALLSSLTLPKAGDNSFYFQMKFVVCGAAKPFIIIASATNFFGVALLLAIVFWKDVIATAGKFGLGFCGVIVLTMLVIGLQTDIRRFGHIFSWIAIVTTIALKDKKLPPALYIAVALMNFGFSKIWLKVNTGEPYSINPDGTVGMPLQKFYMNLGAWMSADMWQLLALATLVSFLLLLLLKNTGKISAKSNKHLKTGIKKSY